jgi:cellobiose transport system substrate-binding protein
MDTGRPTWRRAAVALTAIVLLMSGCSGGDDSGGEAGGKVTLKLSTFGNADHLAELAKEFESSHPDIKVEVNRAATEADARTNMFTKLAAKSGLSDVEMVEVGWTAELREFADQFETVVPDDGGDWASFVQAPATTSDGTMFAYGMGTGPTAICYRSDLLEAAGLPGDPAAVATMVGTWDDYMAAGEDYAAAGGKGWYDSAYMIFDSQIEQMAFPYETEDGDIVADSPEVEAVFRDVLEQAPDLSAGLAPFSEDWSAAMGTGGFATMVCPSWMLTIIEGNSKDVSTWNIANAFPGGGGNLGGSFFVVPKQSDHPDEAAELAQFLTSPESQISDFDSGGGFPSRTTALQSPELAKIANAFFNDAPVGQIFSDRAQAIETNIFKGPNFIAIDTAAFDAITRVETGQQSIDDAWDQFSAEVDDLK